MLSDEMLNELAALNVIQRLPFEIWGNDLGRYARSTIDGRLGVDAKELVAVLNILPLVVAHIDEQAKRIEKLEEVLMPFANPVGWSVYGRIDPDKMWYFSGFDVARARDAVKVR